MASVNGSSVTSAAPGTTYPVAPVFELRLFSGR